VRREHRKLTRAELATITSSRPVVRKIESSRRHENRSRPDARNTVNFLVEVLCYQFRASSLS
jgi:hypothetical protein